MKKEEQTRRRLAELREDAKETAIKTYTEDKTERWAKAEAEAGGYLTDFERGFVYQKATDYQDMIEASKTLQKAIGIWREDTKAANEAEANGDDNRARLIRTATRREMRILCLWLESISYRRWIEAKKAEETAEAEEPKNEEPKKGE